ncbi:GntR family transcriptional regulator [Halomonas sp. McH1-25]|uniref:GntR family transcriptional regulator n=1 Tax=unclassified Halomonas TaxID=2609666 RepID=UPI001EF4101E|nr:MULTISPECIES: GntR family transcriptional regulator [unclassified Halomonas]MCG7602086.1 GntR family transcriptional regulator [Halomonas sp. McH1-25]MCP1343002.1 GntR family transcriptional regulator [Halomonas sp. FL8]MCP1362542.1 GntR family transcriptional regulator [Halomonas sp. BBD45]MCP1364198.1 GntR family transcriptional regulator [Halomonas sp. BBD48]
MKKRYTDVARRIMQDIRAGGMQVGDPMPSEAELCARFGVSRSTIRSALSQLQTLGFVERKQGAATRVTATQAAPTYVHAMMASNDLLQFAGPSWRKVQSITPLIADEELASQLDKQPGKHWVRISQTRHIESQSAPVGWTDVYLCQRYADIVSEIPEYPGLIYTLLEERHQVLIHEIRQTVSAVPVPEYLAERLDVATGDHALRLTRHYLDAEGESLLISINILPANNYRYEIRLMRQG